MGKHLSDIEIARSAEPQNIEIIASKLGIADDDLEHYGKHIAKVNLKCALNKIKSETPGKLVLVSAINPTKAGEGKTTTTVGLCDALNMLGKRSACALREPSLGPVFGIKGGAAGGGKAQVIPMENINLHFTGDFHAIGAANNLLAAMIDAHIQAGNELDIDTRQITWKRCIDMNDRQLRHIVDGLGGSVHGVPREDGFDITVASEVMAVFCLANDLNDLKERLGNIIVAYNRSGEPVYARDLKAEGAMTALLKDALAPNFVQTLEGSPAFVHGGPFANIAHGCNSVIATKLALATADYCVTEAGFGADLGAEKFFDIKCRKAGLVPDCVVLVATVRALKYNGNPILEDLSSENLDALKKGLPNLLRHIENIQNVYNLPVCVAINRFITDSNAEIDMIREACKDYGVEVALSDVWERGGEGGLELAELVCKLAEEGDDKGRCANTFTYAYDEGLSIEDKIEIISKKVYRASGLDFSAQTKKSLSKIKSLDVENYPVCIAKTQYSFSDDPDLLGAPENFVIHVRDVKISNGAGFIVAIAGNIMTMPGLGKCPAAQNIDVDENGNITGLF